jgi:hypothetical protein
VQRARRRHRRPGRERVGREVVDLGRRPRLLRQQLAARAADEQRLAIGALDDRREGAVELRIDRAIAEAIGVAEPDRIRIADAIEHGEAELEGDRLEVQRQVLQRRRRRQRELHAVVAVEPGEAGPRETEQFEADVERPPVVDVEQLARRRAAAARRHDHHRLEERGRRPRVERHGAWRRTALDVEFEVLGDRGRGGGEDGEGNGVA